MGSERIRRVGQLIKQELANLLIRELRDELPAFTTITEVKVSPDLRQARVAVSVMGDDDDRQAVLETLEEQSGHFRYEIGNRIRLKYTPELSFEIDDSLDRVERLEEIFDEIHARDGEPQE